MNRFWFVADHQTTYQVKRLCQVLELSRSAFYAWQKAGPARQQRAEDDAVLAARIRRVQDPKAGGDPAYGAPRVTVELNDGAAREDRVNHKRVARVMRAHQLAGIRLRRRVRTPRSRNRPMRSSVTCCSGTSPPRSRTSVTSVTSPTFRWPVAGTSIWPP